MRHASAGFTLLEVLLALILLSLGLLGFAGTLGPTAALAGAGRAQGRAAEIAESRRAVLQRESEASAPGCLAPPAGWADHPEGLRESWTSAQVGRGIQIQIVLRRTGRLGRLADTVVTRVACP